MEALGIRASTTIKEVPSFFASMGAKNDYWRSLSYLLAMDFKNSYAMEDGLSAIPDGQWHLSPVWGT